MSLRTFEISFDFKYSVGSQKRIKLPFAPFDSGSWTFSYSSKTREVTIKCESCTTVIQEASVWLMTGSPRGPLNLETVQRISLEDDIFPPSPDWQASAKVQYHDNKEKRCARLEVLVEFVSDTPTVRPASQVARCNVGYYKSQSPNDVVFYFPRSNRELWANSAMLKQLSPHFQTMLNSDYKEGTIPTAPFEGATSADGNDDDNSLEDSDDETDKVPLALAATRTSRMLPAGVREIVIDSAAYTTYHAVLVWLQYGHIDFAPLSSPPSPLFSSACEKLDLPEPPSKRARLDDATQLDPDPALPLPASPKSVYQLAHVLEVPELMQLALKNFESQLTDDNVVYQLLCDIAVHDDVKKVILSHAQYSSNASRVMNQLMKPEVLELLPHPLEAAARLFELSRRC